MTFGFIQGGGGNVRLVDGELVDGGGNPIAQPATTWANAPAAVGNRDMVVPITDASPSGRDLFISDGTRWRPLGGNIHLAIQSTQVVIAQANSNKTDNNIVSALKVRIPYSAVNGSMLGDGDVIEFRLSGERSSGGAITLYRDIYVGHHATLPLSNTLFEERNTTTTNIGMPEIGEFHRIDSTTLLLAGGRVLDAWRGPNTNPTFKDTDAVNTLPNMDSADTYIDFCYRYNTNVGTETAYLNYGRIILHSCGPLS